MGLIEGMNFNRWVIIAGLMGLIYGVLKENLYLCLYCGFSMVTLALWEIMFILEKKESEHEK